MRPPEPSAEAEGRWLAVGALGAVVVGAALLGAAALVLGMQQAPSPGAGERTAGPAPARVESATPAGHPGSPSPTPTGDDQPR
ncbi:MAG: hypothetical protein KIT69_19265, partial [Propionibacteriaceae bacterium]|nr:hypothetical protein [Propionibacteriaceae bacterium]